MEEEANKKVETKPEPTKQAWTDATPAGLVALAVACFCYFALLTGLIDGAKSMPIIGCWLLGGFVVQFTVALIDLKNGNSAGGNTFLYFSAFFMLNGAISMFIKGGVIGGGLEVSPKIDGFAWIVLGVTVALWLPAFLKASGELFLICVFLIIAIPFIVMNDLGAVPAAVQAFGIIAGIALLICGLLGIWLAAATIVNRAWGRKIYPTIRPFYRPKNKE